MPNTETNKPWADKSVSAKLRPDVKLAFDAHCRANGRSRGGTVAWLVERFLQAEGWLPAGNAEPHPGPAPRPEPMHPAPAAPAPRSPDAPEPEPGLQPLPPPISRARMMEVA